MTLFKNLSILIICLIVDSSHSKTWICSNSICLKEPISTFDHITYKSQNECRLSCGKFGALWPHPTGYTSISNDRIKFDPYMIRANIIATSYETNKFTGDINKLFQANIANECNNNCSIAKSPPVFLKLSINSNSLELNWHTNESYVLLIRGSDNNIFIDVKSETVFGARHALETLSNLITKNVEGNGLVMVGHANISDQPQFSHRGLLIDTSRHFLPVNIIKSIIIGMSISKMNVLHWHVTDSQSFPMEFPSVPMLHTFGSYSQNEIYTHKDVKHIIELAKVRGVRVIIEIDGPSHSSSGWEWGPNYGLGNLSVCINKQPWREFCIQPPCGIINPLNPNVYDVFEKVYQDLIELIPTEETTHVGGDEVFIPCWNTTEEITQIMKKRGLGLTESSFLKIWSEFHLKNFNTWSKLKTNHVPVILWSSQLTNPEFIESFLPKEKFIVQTWVESDKKLNSDLLNLGYKLIISTKNAWYLDHGFWGKTKFYNWNTVYDNEINNHELVLGGEVCMWGEYVDEHSIEQKIWPRAAAAAERLWSNPSTKSGLAEERFNRLRERLISRGIHPDAITPKWCELNEGQCK
ncbi:hypothetical protein ACFFRR_001113 [Megaselia abdita]